MPYNSLDAAEAVELDLDLPVGPLISVGKTLEEIAEEVQARLGNRADVTDERVVRWINDAYRDMWSSLDLPELKATVAFELTGGEYLYQLPRTVASILGMNALISVDDSRPVTKIDLSTYRRLPDQEDDPTQYFRHGQNLLVFWATPSADRDMTMDVTIRPADLAEPTDSPILPVEWHADLQRLAVATAFAGIGDRKESSIETNSYVAGVRRKVDTVAEERGHMVAAFRTVRNRRDANRLRNSDYLGPDGEPI